MQNPSKSVAVFAGLAALLLAGAAGAEMYKWTDADGNVHYTQTPPPDREADTIAPPPPPAVAPEEARAKAENNRKALRTPEEVEADQKQAQEEAIKRNEETYKQNCQIARDNLQVYQSARRIREPDGTIVRITEEIRQQKIQEAEQAIEKYCKN